MSNQTDIELLHKDLKEQSANIKDLTVELSKLNTTLVEVVADNKHRDARISDCESQVGIVKTDIDLMHTQRTADREEYKPVWDRAKKDQEKKDGWVNNLTWFAIVSVLLVITNSISSGAIKPWFSGHAQKTEAKAEK